MKNAGIMKDESKECGGCGREEGENIRLYLFGDSERAGEDEKYLCAGCVVEHVAGEASLVEVEALINRLKAEKSRRERKISSSYPGRT